MMMELEKSVMHEADKLLLKVQIGECEIDGDAFDMVMVNGNFPAVHSRQSGKTFMFSWEDLIHAALAKEVNVRNPDKQLPG